jgi:hypothetical protein
MTGGAGLSTLGRARAAVSGLPLCLDRDYLDIKT